MNRAERGTMAAVVLGSGIVFLDSSVINLALPRIGQELPSRFFRVLEGQSYVWNGYLLTVSAFLVLAGALNDYFGRKRVFGLGLLGFGVTSLLCGLAPNMELLVLFRLMQGAAGALLVPGSLSIITATFSGEEQGRAFGIWAGASGATTIAGPLVGGLLVDSISWRAAFLINVPLVLVGYWLTASFVAESKDEEATGHLDWVGSLLVAMAVGGLAFGAIRGQDRSWQDGAAFISLGIGAVMTVALPFYMAKARNPLFPLELFRSRNFSVTNISTFLIYGALYVVSYLVSIFLIGTLGYDPPGAGIALIPGTLPLVLFSSRFGALAARFGPRLFMTAGPALMAAGLILVSMIPESSNPWLFSSAEGGLLPPADYFVHFFPGWLLFGIGLMVLVAPLTTALMTSVPPQNSGVASAINNAISRVGPQLVLAVAFVAITTSFYSGLERRVPTLDMSSPRVRELIPPLNKPDASIPVEQADAAREASADAFAISMYISAGLLAGGGFVNGFGIRNPSRRTESPAPR